MRLCLDASQSFHNQVYFCWCVLPGECYTNIFEALLGVILLTSGSADPLKSTTRRADALNKALNTGLEG